MSIFDNPGGYLAEAFDAYVECALWSSIDSSDDGNTDEPLDENYGPADIDTESLAAMQNELSAFIDDVWDDIAPADKFAGLSPGQVGHDFWLTRNHHGAGFWDRGLGERGDRLTKAAHAYGSSDLYVGDDGQVYVS